MVQTLRMSVTRTPRRLLVDSSRENGTDTEDAWPATRIGRKQLVDSSLGNRPIQTDDYRRTLCFHFPREGSSGNR